MLVVCALTIGMVSALGVRGDAVGVSVITNPSCGDVVTQNVVLTGNMSCTGTALEVGADNITIDGRGFRIDGDFIAVLVDSYTGVTITNVTFGPMVAPVVGVGADDLVVQGNRFNWSLPSYSIYNVLLIGSANVRVLGNRMGGDAVFGIVGLGGSGLTITRNSMTHSGAAAVLAAAATGLTVSGNAFARNQLGVLAQSVDGLNVTGNSFRSHVFGFIGGPLSNVQLSGNQVRRTLIGIYAASFDGAVDRNSVREPLPGAIGILAVGNAGTAVAESNTTVGGALGMYFIGAGRMEVQRNIGDRSGSWGIFASAPDLVDGGGNRASGNADPAQCFGVVCASGIGGFSGPGSDMNLASYRLRAIEAQQTADSKIASVMQKARAGAAEILASR